MKTTLGPTATILSATILSATMLATACTQATAPDREEMDEVADALELENGGMDTSDEALDEARYADIPSFEVVEDATDLSASDGARVLTVLLLWGHLPRYEGVDPQTSTDWTGSVQVDGGKIRIDRTVAFDGHDQLLARTDPGTAAFVSHTLPHVDGLLMHVLQQSPDATLTFSTRAATVDVPLSGVAPVLAGHEALGDDANGVTFYAYENRPGCADGFLFGRYRRMAQDLGRFHLRVVDDHGVETGRVRGIYGYSYRMDDTVLFGKVLGLEGSYRGRVAGAYGQGRFSGGWRTDHPTRGVMNGLYWEGRDDRPGRGLAFGHWAEACPASDGE